jgi:phosphoglycerate dehydrogenase-like enzyme
MLSGSSELLWLQTNSAGVEPYLQPGVLGETTLLTNATGAYGLAIAEHLLGMLLELFKKLELYRDAQKQGAWQSLGQVRAVYGATVLVLGMGDIGGEFGKRCKALGAKVIGVRRSPRAATAGLLSRERIARMKEGAVLLNVGRGTIVDTEALCDALESGRLGGAGVDVTDPEPLPPEHRLWRLPAAVVTPHVSGFYHLKETHERIVDIMVENLKRFQAGEPLKNQVDFSTGYRKLT